MRRGGVGTVVVTAGTTGAGRGRRHRARGRRCASATACGCTSTPPTAGSSRCSRARARPGASVPARSRDCDSVVVDPHKHGLQPYGCGAVLFRDPGVGRLYKHDSPYTYFTSDDLHLGEISLECSRAGAAAAALWLTLRALDLAPDARRRRARRARLGGADRATPTCSRCTSSRELDIVTYFPTRGARVGDRRRERRVLEAGMADRRPGLPEHAARRRRRRSPP